MKNRANTRLVLYTLAAPAILAAAASAQGAVMASSSAYAFQSTVSSAESGPVAATSGSAPPKYQDSQESKDLGVSGGTVDYLKSQSKGGASPNNSFAEAGADSDDIESHPQNGYKFSSDHIGSGAKFNSNGGSNTNSSLEDVKLTIGGTEVVLPNKAAPNTKLSDVDGLAELLGGTGISGVVNEQDGDSVNALRISLNDFLIDEDSDAVSGDLVFAHSEASLDGESTGGGNTDNDDMTDNGDDDMADNGLPEGGMPDDMTDGDNMGGDNGDVSGDSSVASVDAPSGPATLLLMGLGFLGIGLAKRRGRNQGGKAV